MDGHELGRGGAGAGMVHDLANVLAVLSASAAMLVEDVAHLAIDHPAREGASRIALAATRAGELCERLRSNEAPAAHDGAFDLSSAVREGIDLLGATVPGMTLSEKSARRLRVRGRSLDALQVLLNLSLNAAEAGGSRVDITVDAWIADRMPVTIGRLAPGRGYARLRVEDDGPGIVDREPFRVGASGSGDPARGHGLAVVAEIMERAGGAVRIGRSDSGGGLVEAYWPRLRTENHDLTGRSLLIVGGTSGAVARIADAAETAGASVSLCLDPLDAVASVAEDVGAWDGVAVLGAARGLAAVEIERRLRHADRGLAILRPGAESTPSAVLAGFADAWTNAVTVREGAA